MIRKYTIHFINEKNKKDDFTFSTMIGFIANLNSMIKRGVKVLSIHAVDEGIPVVLTERELNRIDTLIRQL